MKDAPEVQYTKVVQSIDEVSKLLGKPLKDFTQNDFISLFRSIGCYTAITFQNYKRDIKKCIVYQDGEKSKALLEIKNISYKDINAFSNFADVYFPNFEVLDSTVQNAINYAAKELTGTYNTATAIIYLAWYGFGVEEACDLLKSEIPKQGNIIETKTRVYEIGDYAMAFFREYKRSEAYEMPCHSGDFTKKFYYVDSDYLLRSYRLDKLSPVNLANTLTKLTKKSGITQRLQYEKIRQSGIFYRVYLREKQFGLPTIKKGMYRNIYESGIKEKYTEIFGLDFKNAGNLKLILQQYEDWKQCFCLK